jgi:pimeloyl-ACP methyl ester carboxylesterase
VDVVESSERIPSSDMEHDAEHNAAVHTPMPRNRSRRRELRNAAVALAVVASAIVVVDGSWSWVLLRLALVGVLGWGLYRLEGRWPAVSALVGAVLVAVGAGLAPHLPEFDAVALASALMIVSGGTLVVVGTADLLAGAHWWWRVAGGFAAVAVVAVTASMVTPAVVATNVVRPELGDAPATRGLDAETVTLTTSDGVEIAAWYVPSRNGAAVVLRHGAGSTRSDVLDQATVLAGAGYGVLMTDAQGHGESGGRAMDFGWNGDVEVAAAIDHLVAEAGIERIGLVGMSMGGEEVLGALASQPDVLAAVAEGATARRAADKAWLSDVYGFRGAVQEQFERVQDGVTDLLTEAEPPVALRDAVRRSDAAVLLITAGDVPDEAQAARYIASAAPDRIEVWTVPGAGHTDGLATDPDGWEKRVVAFLDAHL